jgi:hypothetical protein
MSSLNTNRPSPQAVACQFAFFTLTHTHQVVGRHVRSLRSPVVPALCDLHFAIWNLHIDDEISVGMAQLVGFVGRSGCYLRTLCLDHRAIRLCDDLIICLEVMSSLTGLLGREASDSLTERSLRRLTHLISDISSTPWVVSMLQTFALQIFQTMQSPK